MSPFQSKGLTMRLLDMLISAVILLALLGAPAARAEVKDLGDPVEVVYFAADSDEVPAASHEALARAKAAFKASGKKYLVMRGHSDPKEYSEPGSTAQYGIGLAQRRASNVRALLWEDFMAEGAADFNSSLITETYGEGLPKKPGGSRGRVEIFFTDADLF
jgi:outer membrane protein OmpA-like peptidoglycan-associated protein